MLKPKLELYGKSDKDILASATVVKNAMTTNAAKFPTSAAEVTVLGTAITAFTASLQAATDGKVAQQALVDTKDADRDTIEKTLRILAAQVQRVADGDINLIHDAGMQAGNDRSPLTMSQVLSLRLTASDHEGELIADWEPVRGARFYKVQISTDTTTPPNNWTDKTQSPKASCHLNDTLVSGQKVWARVCAVGANDEGAWSDPAVKTVP